MNFFFAQQSLITGMNFWLIMPEVIVCVFAVVVMLMDAFGSSSQRWLTGGTSVAGLVLAGASSIWLWKTWPGPNEAFNGMIVLDELRMGFTVVVLIVAILTLLISMVWVKGEN